LRIPGRSLIHGVPVLVFDNPNRCRPDCSIFPIFISPCAPSRFVAARYSRKRYYHTAQRILVCLSADGFGGDTSPRTATQEGIAEAIFSGRSTVTKWLARLERRGLLAHERCRVRGHPLPKTVYRLTRNGSSEAAALLRRLSADVVQVRLPTLDGAPMAVAEIPTLPAQRIDLTTVVSLIREGRLDLTRNPRRAYGTRTPPPWSGNLRRVEHLFGRGEELRRLDAWLSSRTPALVVTGLPGIGKTALVAGWIQRRRPKASVFAHELHRSTTAAALLADLGGFFHEIGIQSQGSHLLTTGALDFRLLERMLDRDPPRAPLLLILDNADRAAPEVVRLVRGPILALARRRQLKLILISRRSAEGILRAKTLPSVVDVLQIGGLDPASAVAVLRSEGFTSDPAIRSAVAAARGHPMLLRLAAAGGTLRPEGLRAILAERVLRTLSRPERRALETICIFRRPIPAYGIHRISRAPAGIVEDLRSRNLLEQTVAGGVLVHDILRDALLDRMGPARLRGLHLKAAAYCLALRDAPDRWEGIRHLLAAGRPERAAAILDAEGSTLLDSVFVNDVRELLRNVDPTRLTLHTACVFAEARADSLRILGHLGPALLQYQHAIRECERARRLARIPRLVRKMAFIERCRNRYPKALGYVVEALARIDPRQDPAEAGEILRETGLVEQALGELSRAGDHLSEAVDLATEASDLGSLARSLLALGSVETQRGNREEGLQHNLEGLRIAERSGNLTEVARAHIVVGTAMGELRRFGESLHHYEKGLAIAKLLGNLRLVAYGTMNRCAALLDLGRYAEAGAPLQEAVGLVEILEERDTLAFLRIYEGQWEMGLSQWSRAVRAFDRGLDELRKCASPIDLARALKEVGGFHLTQGEVASGERYLKEARAIARKARNEALLAEIDSLSGVPSVQDTPRISA